MLFDGGKETRDGGGICDIDSLMEDFPAGGSVNQGCRLCKVRCVAGANGDAGAFAREFFRNGAAKPFTGGGNDGYASL